MVIVIGLKDLLSGTALQDAGANSLRVLYSEQDTVTVPELDRIRMAKAEISFLLLPALKNEAFLYGYLAGCFVSWDEDILWIHPHAEALPDPITTEHGKIIAYYSSISDALTEYQDNMQTEDREKDKHKITSDETDDAADSNTAPADNIDETIKEPPIHTANKYDNWIDADAHTKTFGMSVLQNIAKGSKDDEDDLDLDTEQTKVPEDDMNMADDAVESDTESEEAEQDEDTDTEIDTGTDELDLGDDGEEEDITELDASEDDDLDNQDPDTQPDISLDLDLELAEDEPEQDADQEDDSEDVKEDSNFADASAIKTIAAKPTKQKTSTKSAKKLDTRFMTEDECYAELRRMISKAGGMAADNYNTVLWTLQQSYDEASWGQNMRTVIPNMDTVRKIYMRLLSDYQDMKQLADQISPVTLRKG